MSSSLLSVAGVSARAVNEFLGKNGPQLAAAISYYALFSLFPLALALTFGLSFFLQEEAIEDIARRVAGQVPISQSTVSDLLSDTLRSRGIAGFAGAIGLLWAGTAVFSAVRKGVNATWGITRPRPFLQERIIDISLMLAAAILMLVSIFSTAALGQLRELVDLITRETQTQINGDLIWERMSSLIAAAVSFIVFVGLYWLLPNTRVAISEALVGATFATIVFEIVKNVFVWYVLNFSVYSSVYGSIGGVVALLTWVYVSANVLLFGSLLTQRYASYRAGKLREIHDIVEAEMARSSLQPVGRE
ncbi:MAG: YihY/virulence factor BrkB family protein [Chloroflexota bacterium]|nr:YihY/virulence factor BrkB family protein [Chloroflexota bacterium]MDE2942318.1 YihY/virulence factor BrkB family protein [Chloroflexota bacterium]MDE3268278.1 YihY/virulence factor BrkB family protein [Chloroflexota bacterium]